MQLCVQWRERKTRQKYDLFNSQTKLVVGFHKTKKYATYDTVHTELHQLKGFIVPVWCVFFFFLSTQICFVLNLFFLLHFCEKSFFFQQTVINFFTLFYFLIAIPCFNEMFSLVDNFTLFSDSVIWSQFLNCFFNLPFANWLLLFHFDVSIKNLHKTWINHSS